MSVKTGFSDFMLVDESGKIEYLYVPTPDDYDFRPEEVIGTTPQQQYNNLSDEASTLMNAVKHGTTTKNYQQELVTLKGNRIRQTSDTYCIRNGEKIAGAIEFAYYDKEFSEQSKKSRPDKEKIKKLSMEDLVGSGEAMEHLRKKFQKVININTPIFLVGETGTGKEMSARIIHNSGKRGQHEFVYVNCGAIPENLLEGILFGIESGSFTDAEKKDGLFKMADKGTLFLDEINTMPAAIQGKILRAIEERRVRPVGGEAEIPVDVRIIASCNAEIDELLRDRRMRKDLYFRLAVIQFELPPLRERREDIEELADCFLRELNEKTADKEVIGIAPDALDFFREYSWPGNVRELKNTIEGAYYAADGEVLQFSDMEERFLSGSGAGSTQNSMADDFFEKGMPLKDYMDCRRKEFIADTLRAHGGALKDAAKALDLSPQMLKYNMEKYGLEGQPEDQRR